MLFRFFRVYVLIQFFFSGALLAQNELPNVVPPSPSAQAFHKYGEYPISHSTGVPDISLPIYEINSNKLSLPISIRFHASGFRPSDLDGILGMNWSLNAGGMISRQIMSTPDDSPTGLLHSNPRHNKESVSSLFPRYGLEYLDNVNLKSIDSEYDVFTYSANNVNGSFILKRIGNTLDYSVKPVLISNNKKDKIIVKLDSDGKIEFFEVIDENGVVFRFGKSLKNSDLARESLSSNSSGPFSGLSTSWLLTDIVSSDKADTISFKYGALRGRFTDSNTFPSGVNFLDFWGRDGAGAIPNQTPTNTLGYSTSSTHYNIRDLEEVDFKNGKILFNYSFNNDNPQQNYLSSIKILNTKQEIRNYDFYISPYTSSRSYRRKLDSVVLNGMEKTKFVYKNDAITALNPLSTDWWGYFNGSYFPSAMTPFMTLLSSRVIGEGINRDANAHMANYMIDKITYPTGGMSSFFFEPNMVITNGILSNIGGIRIAKIVNNDGFGNLTNKIYKYGQNENGGGIATSPFLQDNVIITNVEHHNYIYDSYIAFCTYSTLSVLPYLPSLINYSAPVYYNEVAEYVLDSNLLDNGKTVYKYNDLPGTVIQTTEGSTGCFDAFLLPKNHAPFGRQRMSVRQPTIIASDRYGLLTKKEVYKRTSNQYILVEKDSLDYEINMGEELTSLIVEAKNLYIDFSLDNRYNIFWQTAYSQGPSIIRESLENPYAPFLYENCYIQPSTIKLKSQTNKKYFDGKVVEVGTEFSYQNPLHGFSTSSLRWNKGYNSAMEIGKLTQTFYRRPLDKSEISLTPELSVAIDSMIMRNIIAPIIEEENYYSTREVSVGGYRSDGSKKVKNNYKIWGEDNRIIALANNQFATTDQVLESSIEFHQYNKSSNFLSVSRSGGSEICYVYGYGGIYPIAKIENVDYSMLESILGGAGAVEAFSHILHPTDAEVDVFLAPLRTGLVNSLVTTYTYIPLVGMTSVTDPRGFKIYYEYDSFQRLKNTRDYNGNIIKSNDYHYKP